MVTLCDRVTPGIRAGLMPGVTPSLTGHNARNKSNVFDSTGGLVHELTLVADTGNELGGGEP